MQVLEDSSNPPSKYRYLAQYLISSRFARSISRINFSFMPKSFDETLFILFHLFECIISQAWWALTYLGYATLVNLYAS